MIDKFALVRDRGQIRIGQHVDDEVLHDLVGLCGGRSRVDRPELVRHGDRDRVFVMRLAAGFVSAAFRCRGGLIAAARARSEGEDHSQCKQ